MINLDFQDVLEKASYEKLLKKFGDCRGRRKVQTWLQYGKEEG